MLVCNKFGRATGVFNGTPPNVKSRGRRNDDKRSDVYNLLSAGNGSRLICVGIWIGLALNNDDADGFLFEAIPWRFHRHIYN